MPIKHIQNRELDKELAALPSTPVEQLRQRWRNLFHRDPPPAFGPDLLRRGIAQRIQEDAYGKLSSATQQELNRVVSSLERNPIARIELPRRIKSGAVLVRDWKGKSKRVMVLDKGFAYEGRTYTSLSEIAREITGTRWNGPRFFGLRTSERLQSQELVNSAPRKRGRPPKIARTDKKSTATETGHGL